MQPPAVRLLAATNNARGDLFTRLKEDLFFALGYDKLQFDVHKPGREIDVQGTHRLETRRVVAECKAHKKKMGGDAVNKFRGAFSAERKQSQPTPVAGYFLSLGGFTAAAIEQEKSMGDDAVILLDGQQVVAELERAHVLVGRDEAAERGGRCAQDAGLSDAVLDGAELLGHELGYLWAVFYAHGKERTHFALIHADGTPLAEAVAGRVIDADRKCRGTLYDLDYLAPAPPAPDRAALGREAVERYCEWVGEECGYIQLDGLPADTDLAATRMKLERLFVPLKLVLQSQRSDNGDQQETEEWTGPVGEFLESHPQLALLAAPGGGKSTLLRRLAIAYAVPGRRAEVDDRLPERDWLPLFLRCRELRDRAHRPILELLGDLPQHAGMDEDQTAAFREHTHDSLRSGRALLLVDGLDEISDEGARRTFAGHLRTFLAMFPHAALVVTSREAGFRQVAGVVAGACTQAKLAPFDEHDVRRLCERWHVEVVGDKHEVRSEARELAETIWNNERVRALAENPLMLTTLLVVKGWIGELPNRRVELYGEAVRVLIRTWNTEGFEPMDLEETLTQLSYVACTMMNEGTQQIGHKALLRLLGQARRELAAELQFARISPQEFIERIEYRSSLLMQTGHERIDGELEPVYEFRHLTFQEYLAARGLVEEQYPGRDVGHSLADLLEPHFEDERWQEVIPLAAVLAGRRAEELIQRLTTACEGVKLSNEMLRKNRLKRPCVVLLRQCLLDEVQVTPSTLHAALRQMVRLGAEWARKGSVVDLRRGKFGEAFEEVAEDAYFGNDPGWEKYQLAMKDLALEAVFQGEEPRLSNEVAERLAQRLTSVDRIEQGRAALVCSRVAPVLHAGASAEEDVRLAEQLQRLRDALGRLLGPEDPALALAACSALAGAGAARLPGTRSKPNILLSLYRLWRDSESCEVARYAAWAFATQPLLPRDSFDEDAWGDCDEWFEQTAAKADPDAPLVLAWYRRRPWTDSELAEKVGNTYFDDRFRPTAREILATLGEPGRRVLEEWDKRDADRMRRR